MTTIDEKIDVSFQILARFDGYIDIANTKANTLMTFILTLLIASVALIDYGHAFDFKVHCELHVFILFISIITGIINILSFLELIKVILPDTKNVSSGSSLIFFGDIANRVTAKNYAEAVKLSTSTDFLEDLSFQNFNLASITNSKFACLKKATKLITYGVIPLTTFILILSVISKNLG